MKRILLFFCFFCIQLNFGQKAFIHGYYDKCNFFKELTQKEIENCVTIKKDTSGFKITFKIPITKDLKEFIEIYLSTSDTKFQKYGVGHDAFEWIELGKEYNSHTGFISTNFQTKCAKRRDDSDVDSSGFIELINESSLDKLSGYFRANVNGVVITGAFKNVTIN